MPWSMSVNQDITLTGKTPHQTELPVFFSTEKSAVSFSLCGQFFLSCVCIRIWAHAHTSKLVLRLYIVRGPCFTTVFISCRIQLAMDQVCLGY